MKRCKWLPLLFIGIISFIVGCAWSYYIQDLINVLVTDPAQNLVVKTVVTAGITIIAIVLIWYLAGCWNDKEHWLGKKVYCDI